MSADERHTADGSLRMVLGYLAIKELETLEERVSVLARLGYENKEIARICDTTTGSVSVRKAGLRKPKKATKRGKGQR